MKKMVKKRRLYKDYKKTYFIDDQSYRYSIINGRNLDRKGLIFTIKLLSFACLFTYISKYLFF